jgi:tetratricopeptide (TPR) repeat protein
MRVFCLFLCLMALSARAQTTTGPLGSVTQTLWLNQHPAMSQFHSKRLVVQLENGPLRPFRRRGANGEFVEITDTTQMQLANLKARAFHYGLDYDFERMVAALEGTAQRDPKQHYEAARAYLRDLHDYPRALHHLDAYDALTPDFDDSDGLFPVSFLKGLCYRNLGNHAEAVQQFNKGIDSLAKKHGSEWVNYKQYVSRAVSYLALQQPDKAMADLDSAAKNATSPSPLVFYYKGKAYEQQGRPDDAKRTFRDAHFFWQANRVKGIRQPEDINNPILEADIEVELK